MTSTARWVIAVLAAGIVPAALQADWQLTYECVYGPHDPSCGGNPGPLTQYHPTLFNTESECLSAPLQCDAVLAHGGICDHALVSSQNRKCECLIPPCIGGGGSGGGSSGIPIDIPGGEFLPPGNLLRDSPYEHLAGGLNSFGDISQMGTGYGDAFFTRHYTHSTNDWIDAAKQRFQNYLDANRRHRDRFGAGNTPAELAKSPFASPFGQGVSKPPASTAKFENRYMDDMGGSDFFRQLQTGQTGPLPAVGRNYMTLEEMERQRLQQNPNLPASGTSGLPIGYPEKPAIKSDQELFNKGMDYVIEQYGEGAKEGAEWLGDKGGMGTAVSNAVDAGGIYVGYVKKLGENVKEMIQCGAAGDMKCYDEAYDKMTGNADDLTKEVQDFTINRFTSAMGDAVGGIGKIGAEAVGSGIDFANKIYEKVKGRADAGETVDLKTVGQEIKKEGAKDLVEYGMKNGAAPIFVENAFPTVNEKLKKLKGPDGD